MSIFNLSSNDGDNAGYVWNRVIWMLIIGGLALILICVDDSVEPEKGLPVAAKTTDTTKIHTAVIKTVKAADSTTITSTVVKPTAPRVVEPPSDREPEETIAEQRQESGWKDFMAYLSALGAAVLMGGASFACGGIIGFLFGIPKIQQADSVANSEAIIIQNDNLYVISDWITKIIVGVGLVQLKEMPSYLHKIGRVLAPVLTADTEITPVATGSVVCIILYFFSVGFFALYLWTRLDYVLLLKRVNEKLRLIVATNGLVPITSTTTDPIIAAPVIVPQVTPVTPPSVPAVTPPSPTTPPANPAGTPPAEPPAGNPTA